MQSIFKNKKIFGVLGVVVALLIIWDFVSLSFDEGASFGVGTSIAFSLDEEPITAIYSNKTGVRYELNDLKTAKDRVYPKQQFLFNQVQMGSSGSVSEGFGTFNILYEGSLGFGTRVNLEFEVLEYPTGNYKLALVNEEGVVFSLEGSDLATYNKTHRILKSGNYAIILYSDHGTFNHSINLVMNRI